MMKKSLETVFVQMEEIELSYKMEEIYCFGYLKTSLFPREYLDKKVGVLSGGEKQSCSCPTFHKKVDCLILDEPTNDLDIPTINIILREYFSNFQGVLIFVSYDRYFLVDKLQKTFVFQGNSHIMESFQPYSEYLEIGKKLRESNT